MFQTFKGQRKNCKQAEIKIPGMKLQWNPHLDFWQNMDVDTEFMASTSYI
jgi:hypothetical protein